MPVLQEVLKVNGWSIQKNDWVNEAGKVDYLLFPPNRSIDQTYPTIQLFLQRNIGTGEVDFRFPTQITAADFLSHVSKFVSETKEVQAPSRHELLLGRIRKSGLIMETIESELQRASASQTKMHGHGNGIYVFNNTDDEISLWELGEDFDPKVADLPETGSELNPETFAVSLREKLPGQSLHDSSISVATESAVVTFFPPDFAIKGPAHIFIYAPAEHLSMALSLLHGTAGMSDHTIPLDYIDNVVRTELGQF